MFLFVLFENDNLIVIYFLGIEIFFVMSNDNYYYIFSVSLFFFPVEDNIIQYDWCSFPMFSLPELCLFLGEETGFNISEVTVMFYTGIEYVVLWKLYAGL